MNTNRKFRRTLMAIVRTMFLAALCHLAHGQTYIILHSFQCAPDGVFPLGNLIADAMGNIYGTTQFGGTGGYGTVYRLMPDGTVAVLYNFANGLDGAEPMGGVVMDSLGNLYGTTAGDQVSTNGTVFELGSDGTFTVLHSFTGGADGATPFAGLLRDGSTGTLYGTTMFGGNGNAGVVFSLSSTGHGYKVLSSGIGFPSSALIRDRSGNLYGTSRRGGALGAGMAFELDAAGDLTVLHSFGAAGDGVFPAAGLIRDEAGNLYGTTQEGGSGSLTCGNSFGCGVVFKLSANDEETVLFNFTGKRDGGQPVGGVVIDSKGNLYGTTSIGGKQCPDASSCGMVFQISSDGQKEKVLHAFTGVPDGYEPLSGLLYRAGNFYGTTYQGGANNCGTIFQVNPKAATLQPR